jgi:hypothetical protein
MKKRALLILLSSGFLLTGFSQAFSAPSPCFETCLMQYSDCAEIYGQQLCWAEFMACRDQCD